MDDYEGVTHAGIAVQASDSGRVLLQQRAFDPTDAPEVQGTWEFPGGHLEEGETPEAAGWREWSEETGLIMPEHEITGGWRSTDGVYQGFVATVESESVVGLLNPDAADLENPDDPDRSNPDISAWFTIEQIKNMGAAVRPEVLESTDWSQFASEEGDMAEDQVDEQEFATTDDIAPVPWFGIIAPEGKWSGDGRMFREGALRSRPLPLPLTWQKVSTSGHDQAVTVAKIEEIWRQRGYVWGAGHSLQTPEANEWVGLVGEFGRFGVSVDADDLDEFSVEFHEGNRMEFTDARACSACTVSIPAFAEAFVSLGTFSEDVLANLPAPSQQIEMRGETTETADAEVVEAAGGWGTPSEQMPPMDDEPDCSCDPEDENYTEDCECDEEESMVASAFADLAPGKTEDGPGWLTHPVDTDRLRDYWVRGEGAAKIAWGTPGDFNRCRTNLAKYVKPQYLEGYCANRHYDALGIWPGEHAGGTVSANTETNFEVEEPASLVASAPRTGLPGAWFSDPGLEGPTPITVTDEGKFFGHLATWGTCHIGFNGECVSVPHSATDYAYFMTGMIETADGPVFVGNISMGGGHAEGRLGWRPAVDHYDSTSTVIADVACGEDEFGVWVSGAVRSGVTPEQIAELQASGGLSGDWREVRRGSGELELVAALAVNVGGFPVPRLAISASAGHTTSLVAAGVVVERDPVDDLADAVFAKIEEKQKVSAARAALSSKVAADRLAALREEI